ncbi:MAG: 6-carboxytetrahydropterin synthase [Pseudomonadota bacterium]|nr:6-carboxytetrahydropterin synthase [Pseudomonadota bacterium]
MTGLFVAKLNQVDFCYLDPERGLLGESWWYDIVLYGELDDQGMIFDFGPAKKLIKQRLDEWVDHKLLLPMHHENVSINKSASIGCCDPVQDSALWQVDWAFAKADRLTTQAPASAFTELATSEITPEAVAEAMVPRLMTEMPDNVTAIDLSFYNEPLNGAYYHYSHGLKKHQGNCQRIAHGHRSTIEIYRDGRRDAQLESLWAERFCDIHLITQEDLVQDAELRTVAYQAPQGRFELTLPARCTYLMDQDTTVENIAAHIAKQCKANYPESTFRVRAFEGINKGAEVKS